MKLLAVIFLAVFTTTASAERLTTAETLHYNPWFVRNNSVEQAAQAVMDGVYQPYADNEPWEFDFPIAWDERGQHRNWRSVLHSFYVIDPLALQYEATGEERYLDRTLDIVRDWHRFHFIDGREAEFSWSDATAGIRSMKIAWLYSTAQDNLSEADRSMLYELAEAHIEKVLDGSVEFRMTNHGIFQIHGMVTICAAFDLQALCAQAEPFIHEKLTALIGTQFDHEGIHVEHSTGYHRLAINLFDFFVSTGLYEDYPELVDAIALAKQNMFWLSDPANDYWQIGDTAAGSVPQAWREYYPELDCNPICMRAFDFGYVSIKSSPDIPAEKASGLFIQGAFHSPIHKNLDDLSFEVFENGQKVLTASGAYGYETSLERRYVQSTRSHNTVEIGQKDFSRKPEYAYGSAIRSATETDGVFNVVGVAYHPEIEAFHKRTFDYEPSTSLRIVDEVTFGGATEQVAQWFHFHPDAEFVDRTGSRIELSLSGSPVILTNANGCPSTVRKGRREPRLDGWYSPSNRVLVPRYSIAFICDGSQPIDTTMTFAP